MVECLNGCTKIMNTKLEMYEYIALYKEDVAGVDMAYTVSDDIHRIPIIFC
jgi:hypothetical protein